MHCNNNSRDTIIACHVARELFTVIHPSHNNIKKNGAGLLWMSCKIRLETLFNKLRSSTATVSWLPLAPHVFANRPEFYFGHDKKKKGKPRTELKRRRADNNISQSRIFVSKWKISFTHINHTQHKSHHVVSLVAGVSDGRAPKSYITTIRTLRPATWQQTD